MNYARIHSAQFFAGIVSFVDIEIDISKGLHSFNIIGLCSPLVNEAKDRISSAIKYSGFESPKRFNHKIVISLNPADIKKDSTSFDVGMALSYLLAKNYIFNHSLTNIKLNTCLFLGGVQLNGEITPVKGISYILDKAKDRGFETVYIPQKNSLELKHNYGLKIFLVKSLKDIVDHLNKDNSLLEYTSKNTTGNRIFEYDIDQVMGNGESKRACLISVTGGHSLALWGPAGSGKTLLAKCLPSIMPQNKHEEKEARIIKPPFINPHHSSSYASIIGGNNTFGEITLADRGILFLDEFPEFDRRVIESLREPLEEKSIRIGRVSGTTTYPLSFLFVIALNPCPCGLYGENRLSKYTESCKCSGHSRNKYLDKISGPIIDRIEIWTNVNSNAMNTHKEFDIRYKKMDSSSLRKWAEKAIDFKKDREKIKNFNPLIEAENYINLIKNRLSMRSIKHIMSISRTIADLEFKPEINENHFLEALKYKTKPEIFIKN